MDNKGLKEIFKTLPLVGQLGISLVMPLLLCFLLSYWLVNRFGIGQWVYIIALVFGLGASFMTAYKVYLSSVNKSKKDKKPVAFNRHM